MKSINLIYYHNGVGLVKDTEIIKNILINDFIFNDCDAYNNSCPNVDINLYFQNLDPNTINFIPNAKLNILIPNLEWFSTYNLNNINKFDVILTKSIECKEILSKYHNNVIYIGFTSIDRYNSNIPKIKRFLHFGGRSIQKYTELIIDIFTSNEVNLPITIVDATQRFLEKITPNINYINYYLPEEEVNNIFNSHNIHICCSLSEGWGHYIYEALSCKSVVLINDCPPENELLKKEEAVYKLNVNNNPSIDSLYFHTENEYPFRKLNYTDKNHLIDIINKLSVISIEDINNIGEKSRLIYNNIDMEFKLRFKEIFRKISA